MITGNTVKKMEPFITLGDDRNGSGARCRERRFNQPKGGEDSIVGGRKD